MTKEKIIELFDTEKYKEVYDFTNPYTKNDILDYEILYFLKSKLVLDYFKIKDKKEIKKLLFYYFYLVWKVEFENNYSFYFKKDLLKLNFKNLEKELEWLKDFKKYFELWKNDVFLNKIIDETTNYNEKNIRQWAIKVNNIIEFFIEFTKECSELYTFSWEHFPLFKWLINELSNVKLYK